ncbi:hypothetical protein GN956_G4868 [Arapaima gigas]
MQTPEGSWMEKESEQLVMKRPADPPSGNQWGLLPGTELFPLVGPPGTGLFPGCLGDREQISPEEPPAVRRTRHPPCSSTPSHLKAASDARLSSSCPPLRSRCVTMKEMQEDPTGA